MMSNEDLDLIAAGFTAILGFRVVHGLAGEGLPKLGIRNLFHCTYIPRSLVSVAPQEAFDVHVRAITGASSLQVTGPTFGIHVKTITGFTTTVQVTGTHTVAQLKAAVETQTNIPGRDQQLMFDQKRLEDHQTISELGIPPSATIFLLVRTRGGGPDFQLDPNELDPKFNYDFTNEKDDGKTYKRGGKLYKRPYGWKRFAVKVLDVYESNTWLGPNGVRTEDAPGEWPVSYHGTNLESAKAIMGMGYKIGHRQRFENVIGKAVYSSPSLDFVARDYATKFTHKGDNWKVVLQNRVNPAPDHLRIIDPAHYDVEVEYWLSPKQDIDNNVFDVRPYGLLFKKV